VGHILIAGAVGSGKTSLLQSVTLSLVLQHHRRQIQIAMIDPVEHGLDALSELPHMSQPVASTAEKIELALAAMHSLMVSREASTNSSTPLIVIAIEHLDVVLRNVPSAAKQVSEILVRGRAVGVHIVATASEPFAVKGDGFALTPANFTIRVVGHVADSKMSADFARTNRGIGAEKLDKQGDFIAVTTVDAIRFQSAHIEQAELNSVIAMLLRDVPAREILACKHPAEPKAHVDITQHLLDGIAGL
jgi:S-DNA-T family DNA segregation ATPase FtsK/SpoIIIE